MTHSLKPSLPPNVQGILWMTLSMAAFALEDLFVKRAVQALPLSEVLVLCGLGGALVFAVLAWGQGVRLLQPAARSRLMAGRALFELVGRLFYALAIALTPLSTTTAILQATPVLVVLGGSLFFHERVGWRRWVAVGVGLLGVLIVLRPGADGLSLGHLAALTAAVCSSLASIIVRKIGAEERSVVLLLYPMVANFALLGCALPFVYKPMPIEHLGMLGIIAAFGFVATLLVIMAYRRAEAVVVAPMQYSQMIWAIFYGYLIFDETPDEWTLIGAGVIIASGIYIVLREDKGTVSENRPVLTTRSRPETGLMPRISLLLRRGGRD